MNQAQFYERLSRYKMIASVKEAKCLEKAAKAELSAVVPSVGNIGIIKRYIDFFKEHHLPVFPIWVKEGLQALRTAGCRLAILTNKLRSFIMRELHIPQLTELFHSIVTVNNVWQGKPSVESLQKAFPHTL